MTYIMLALPFSFFHKPTFQLTPLDFHLRATLCDFMITYIRLHISVRCSSIPLRPNPFEATITMLRDHLSSPDAILDALLSPSPSKSSTVNEKKPMPTVQNRIFAPVAGTPIAGPQLSRAAAGAGRPPALGGRFLRPALPLWLAQILVHAASGCLFSFSFASSILPAGAGPEARGALHITCAFSSFLTVLLSVLWDGSHEIKYRSHFSARTSYAVLDVVTSLAVRTSANLQRANLIPYLVLVPVLCHTALFVTDPGIERDGYWSADIHPNHLSRTGGRFFAAVVSLVASIAIATYQVLVDTMIRRSLTAPGLDVDRLLYPLPCHGRVEGRAGGTDLGTGLVPFLPDDLIVQSIVWGCDGGGGAACGQLVRDLIAPRLGRASAHGPVYGGVSAFNMEEEEVRRSDAAIDAVAGAMLPSFVAATHGLGMLEEDTLRLALLESLGGTAPEEEINGAPAEARSLGLSSRHYHALRNRLQASEAAAAQRTQRIPQPMVVPLVRALCAYAGGLGEALVRISIQDSTFVETAAVGTSSSKRGVQYILPAGATACAKFSLLAAARLVALNAQARRHGWLSLLVPSVLHSAHRLRSGVLRYGESLMQRGTLWNGKGFAGLDANTHDKKIGKFIAIECPDLSRLLADCDEAATIIVRSLMHQDGARDTEIKVHSGCRKWLNGLQ